jgi:uncharacterized membrane protein
MVGIILFARHRLHAAVATSLIGLFCIIISLNQTVLLIVRTKGPTAADDHVNPTNLASVAMLLVLTLIILALVPAKAVSRRLIFLALGLLLLIALNELSKLGLDVTAPKQG